MIMALLLVSLFAVSAVNAADNVTNDVFSEKQIDDDLSTFYNSDGDGNDSNNDFLEIGENEKLSGNYYYSSIKLNNQSKYVINYDNEQITFNGKIVADSRGSVSYPEKGEVTYTINSIVYSSQISKGVFSKSFLLKPGEYKCKISFKGYRDIFYGDYYDSCSYTFKFTVFYKPIINNVPNFIIAPGEFLNVKTTVYSDINYYRSNNLILYIGDKETSYTKSNLRYSDDKKTKCSFDVSYQISFSKHGLYNARFISSQDNNNFYEYSYNSHFINVVDTPKITYTVDKSPIYAGDKMHITLNAVGSDNYDVYQGQYTILVDSSKYIVDIKKDMGSLQITTPKKPGIYKCIINYNDPIKDKYKNSSYPHNYYENAQTSFEINLKANSAIVMNNDILYSYNGEDILFDVNVVDHLGQNIDGGKISINFNNKKYEFNVNNGKANVKLKIDKLGKFNCPITFYSNDGKYQSSNDMFTIISKNTIQINIKSASSVEGKSVKLVAYVKDGYGNNIKTGYVIFEINKKSYKVNVRNGQAVLTIKCPKAKFYYSKYSSNKKIQIEKNYYKSKYGSEVSYFGDNYVSSDKSFSITSTKKDVKKYKITKYRTVKIKPKFGLHKKKMGKYYILTEKFKKDSKTMINVVVGIKYGAKYKVTEFYSQLYVDNHGYTIKSKTVHIKSSKHFSELFFKNGLSLKFIKLKFFDRKLIK